MIRRFATATTLATTAACAFAEPSSVNGQTITGLQLGVVHKFWQLAYHLRIPDPGAFR